MRPKGEILFGLFVCFDGCQNENRVQFDRSDPQQEVRRMTGRIDADLLYDCDVQKGDRSIGSDEIKALSIHRQYAAVYRGIHKLIVV